MWQFITKFWLDILFSGWTVERTHRITKQIVISKQRIWILHSKCTCLKQCHQVTTDRSRIFLRPVYCLHDIINNPLFTCIFIVTQISIISYTIFTIYQHDHLHPFFYGYRNSFSFSSFQNSKYREIWKYR